MVLSLVNRLQRWRLERAGFQPRLLAGPTGNLHALEFSGGGPLPQLVVVHGICAEGAQFADTLMRLRPHFSRIVVPDLPAHGWSSDPSTGLTTESLKLGSIQLLDDIIEEPSLVLGNSLGGLVSVRYALERPENVRALYLSSPAGGYQPPDDFQHFVQRLHVRTWWDGIRFVNLIFGAPPWHRSLIGGSIRRLFSRPTMATFVHSLTTDDLLSEDELRALAMPARVVWGGRDGLLPREQLEFYRQHLPEGSLFEEPPHWGHCPYLDTPVEFADSILSWARDHA